MQNIDILLSFQMELRRPESGNDIVARRGVLQRKSNVFFEQPSRPSQSQTEDDFPAMPSGWT